MRKQKLGKGLRKHDPGICCPLESQFRYKNKKVKDNKRYTMQELDGYIIVTQNRF